MEDEEKIAELKRQLFAEKAALAEMTGRYDRCAREVAHLQGLRSEANRRKARKMARSMTEGPR